MYTLQKPICFWSVLGRYLADRRILEFWTRDIYSQTIWVCLNLCTTLQFWPYLSINQRGLHMQNQSVRLSKPIQNVIGKVRLLGLYWSLHFKFSDLGRQIFNIIFWDYEPLKHIMRTSYYSTTICWTVAVLCCHSNKHIIIMSSHSLHYRERTYNFFIFIFHHRRRHNGSLDEYVHFSYQKILVLKVQPPFLIPASIGIYIGMSH